MLLFCITCPDQYREDKKVKKKIAEGSSIQKYRFVERRVPGYHTNSLRRLAWEGDKKVKKKIAEGSSLQNHRIVERRVPGYHTNSLRRLTWEVGQ